LLQAQAEPCPYYKKKNNKKDASQGSKGSAKASEKGGRERLWLCLANAEKGLVIKKKCILLLILKPTLIKVILFKKGLNIFN
jgi:hypothetical protein